MIKSITIAHKKPGLTIAEFNKYWKEQHGPLAARLIPGIRKYVQNHLIMVPGQKYEGDGIVEMWYEDLEAFQKSLEFIRSSRELAVDGAKFSEMRAGGAWLAEEYIIKDDLGI